MKYLIFIILFFFTAQFIFFLCDQAPDTDEAAYMSFARNILSLGYPSENGKDPYLIHPPLFPYLIALFFKIGGISLSVARLISLLAGLGVLLLTYLIGREIKGEKTALLSTAFLAGNPCFLYFSQTVYIEMLLSFLLFTSIFYFVRGWKRSENKCFFGAGFFLGLALITKYSAAILLAAFLIYSWLQLKGKIFFQKRIYFFLAPTIGFLGLWIGFGLMIDASSFCQQQKFLFSYFKPGAWHLSHWRIVPLFTHLKRLLGVLTPLLCFSCLAALGQVFFKMMKRKIKKDSFSVFFFILLILFFIGICQIRLKDIHYPVPIVGIMILFVFLTFEEYFIRFWQRKWRIVLGVFCLWSVSPLSVFYDPLTNKFYDNLYLFGIKRDVNYRAYKKLAHFLQSIVKEGEIIAVENKAGVVSWYLNRDNPVYQFFLFYLPGRRRILARADWLVLEEGISRLPPADEREFQKLVEEKFVLRKTFEASFVNFPITTDLKPLPTGEKKKTFYLYQKRPSFSPASN